MSSGKLRNGGKRAERRNEQFAALKQRAEDDPHAGRRREHITPIEVTAQEKKYAPLLMAIESGLAQVYVDRQHLPVDDEADRALRLLISHYEGDTSRRSGSPDVDAMVDQVNHNIELVFRRHPLLTRAEIIGCLRRIISSVATWHEPSNPRAYFEFAREVVSKSPDGEDAERTPSGIWMPGSSRSGAAPDARPPRSSSIWLPGDQT